MRGLKQERRGRVLNRKGNGAGFIQGHLSLGKRGKRKDKKSSRF